MSDVKIKSLRKSFCSLFLNPSVCFHRGHSSSPSFGRSFHPSRCLKNQTENPARFDIPKYCIYTYKIMHPRTIHTKGSPLFSTSSYLRPVRWAPSTKSPRRSRSHCQPRKSRKRRHVSLKLCRNRKRHRLRTLRRIWWTFAAQMRMTKQV